MTELQLLNRLVSSYEQLVNNPQEDPKLLVTTHAPQVLRDLVLHMRSNVPIRAWRQRSLAKGAVQSATMDSETDEQCDQCAKRRVSAFVRQKMMRDVRDLIKEYQQNSDDNVKKSQAYVDAPNHC